MKSINEIIRQTNKPELEIKERGQYYGIAPRCAGFSNGKMDIEYTDMEAETIIDSYGKP